MEECNNKLTAEQGRTKDVVSWLSSLAEIEPTRSSLLSPGHAKRRLPRT